jgi:hypothetical protein
VRMILNQGMAQIARSAGAVQWMEAVPDWVPVY